jgi:N-methylhydantoinase B
LHGQVAAGNIGKQRFIELLEEYGSDTVLSVIAELMDRAEAMTREKLSAIPDGSYTFADYLDNDGIDLDRRVTIQATVTIKGSDVYCDFTGTSPQVRGPLNCVPTAAIAGAYYVIRTITDPSIPNNSGCYRSIQLHLPEGSVVNPRPPAAVNARTATIIRIADVLHGALIQALPGKLPAAPSGQLLVASFGGIDPRTGIPYVTSELGAGGVGARPNKDGIDVLEMGPSNCMNIPAESIEMSYPLRIRHYGLRHDSGGAGCYRGGLGATKVFEAVYGDVVVSIRGERYFTPPWGLYGGQPAAVAQAWVERADGSTEEIPSKRVFTLHQGERLHVDTPGGGGYGDPLERDPEAVRQDVCDRRVTVRMARELYGVVLEEPSWCIDHQATQRLRATLRRQRGVIDWVYDRGPLGKV